MPNNIVTDENPPTYEEAIKVTPPPANRPQHVYTHSSSSYSHTSSSQSLIRPPRPSSSSHSAPPTPNRPSQTNSALYSNNPNLPFQYPKGFLCHNCKNTGFKVKNGKICLDCWKRFYIRTHAYNPNPNLPFKFPKGYLCTKCNNTGVKLKNGLSCKDCYGLFSPRNTATHILPNFSIIPLNPGAHMMVAPQPVAYAGHQPPALRVLPGDPRIGGILCGRCRGSGLVLFFLDEDICPVCNGVGRIINNFSPTANVPLNPRPFGWNGPWYG